MTKKRRINSNLVVCILFGLQVNTVFAEMDHNSTQMPGWKSPADARDPHAYSDGYTLTEGPYALPGPRQLKLADEHQFWAVIADKVEYHKESDSTIYDLQAWYGTTYNRLIMTAEGDIADSTFEESSIQLLWSRAFNPYFNTQLGMSFEQTDKGVDRQWFTFGLQGLAPYWIELDIFAHISNKGRTALDMEAEYELLFTQRLVLQPSVELSLYSKDDQENKIGSGLAFLSVGFRLGYEISRQFVPYIGMEWKSAFGETADFQNSAGEETSNAQIIAGLSFWF